MNKFIHNELQAFIFFNLFMKIAIFINKQFKNTIIILKKKLESFYLKTTQQGSFFIYKYLLLLRYNKKNLKLEKGFKFIQ